MFVGSLLLSGPGVAELAHGQAPANGQAYSVPVQPCGEFGKPACGTRVQIPAGATGESLLKMAKASVDAGRTWEAIIFIEQSAMRGYAPAETSLGLDFSAGMGVPQSWQKARYWLGKAADQGVAEAQADMGEMYEKAQGGPPDQVKAAHYYELAAAQHNSRGEMRLGIDYELGRGVPHDREKAISLLRESEMGFSWAVKYVNALSHAGNRRFSSQAALDAYVSPTPVQTQTQSNVPAGCPAMLNFSVTAYGLRSTFCSRNPGCPYQVNGGAVQTCARLPNGYGVN
jgi:hypothetical protein